MSKNLLEDMVKVKTTKRETATERELDSEVEEKFNSYYNNLSSRERKEKKRVDKVSKPRNGLWFVALASVVILFFALSFLFSKATITIHPKEKDVALNQVFVAAKNASADDLPFDLAVIGGEETTTLASNGEQDVTESAKGTVVIYNAYSSSSQGLDINTRLEGSNGKIYKTVTKTIVPGMKGSTPGSVQVAIYASEPGAEYNSTPLDFKIFGFKGTPKYAKFYARSTEAIAGGFKGKSSIVSDDDKAKAINDLKNTLQATLLKKISDQIPTGFVLFKDAVFLSVDNVAFDSTASESEAVLTMKGTLYGFLFDEAKLTKKIVEKSIPDYDDNPVHIANMGDLVFSLSNKENVSFKDITSIVFNLSGTAKVVWDVDVDKLVGDVVGKKKKDFNLILAQYPNIDSADLAIRPVWRMSFPDNKNDIKLIVSTP